MFEPTTPNQIEITLSGIPIKITRKRVKNINLRVYPARREVCISAPHHLPLETIHDFARSKQDWIQKHFKKYRPRRPISPDFTDGERHYYRGVAMKLQIKKHEAPATIKLFEDKNVLEMWVRPGSDKDKRAKILTEWYRARLKEQIPKLIEKWESPMGVAVQEFGVKQMKTRWGSCTSTTAESGSILNSQKNHPSAWNM